VTSNEEQARIQALVNQPDESSTCRDLKLITFLVPPQTNPELLQLIRDDRVEFELVAVLPDADIADASNRFSFVYVTHPEESDDEEDCCCGSSTAGGQESLSSKSRSLTGRRGKPVKRLVQPALAPEVAKTNSTNNSAPNCTQSFGADRCPSASELSATLLAGGGFSQAPIAPAANDDNIFRDADWLSTGELPHSSSSSSSISGTWRNPTIQKATSSSSSHGSSSSFEPLGFNEWGPQNDDEDLFSFEVVPRGEYISGKRALLSQ
jgi:hypothetical protein